MRLRVGDIVEVRTGAEAGVQGRVVAVHDGWAIEVQVLYSPHDMNLLGATLSYPASRLELVERKRASLIQSVAPVFPEDPGEGMSSPQLAEYVGQLVEAVKGRIVGIGAEQYDEGDGQKFEKMDLGQLLDWANEELEDVVVYAAMLRIRINRIKDKLSGKVNL